MDLIRWLMNGDPVIRYQTQRDLMASDQKKLDNAQRQMEDSGWCSRLLALQDKGGTWGNGLYSPKWTSTTYTLLLLRRFGLRPSHPQAQRACRLLIEKGHYSDGGINFAKSLKYSETCVTGMVLSILAYFEYPDQRRQALVDFLLNQQMPDGGWNCQSFKGAVHSSFHTTVNVLEGLYEEKRVSPYKKEQIESATQRAHEFLLQHRLFRSHRTGAVVDPQMTRLSFPPRWRHDILRILDYFQQQQVKYDNHLQDALDIILKKRNRDSTWNLQQRYPGRTFFELETPGQSSRWNTLRALRVLYWIEHQKNIL